MKKQYRLIAFVIVSILLLTACANATTASCAFVVGNGVYDSKVHKIIYPGQSLPDLGTDEDIKYVPCNSRNYLINDGTTKNANGQTVGDEPTLIRAKTSSGTDILIAVSAYWTLNQNEEALRAFYTFQLKYKAASEQDIAGDFNSSTEGWNSMLGENFGPAIKRAAREGASLTTDAIWQTNDVTQTKILTDYLTEQIDDKLRQNVGYNDFDLFCGSGQSQWPDPNKPGVGEFYCAPIRIVVDYVIRNPDQSNASTQGSITLSQQRLLVAQELYGENAGCWLGLQDLVQACVNSGSTTCVFNFNGNVCGGSLPDSSSEPPVIVVPEQSEPTPTPAP